MHESRPDVGSCKYKDNSCDILSNYKHIELDKNAKREYEIISNSI